MSAGPLHFAGKAFVGFGNQPQSTCSKSPGFWRENRPELTSGNAERRNFRRFAQLRHFATCVSEINDP
jgi:hypothetical protein